MWHEARRREKATQKLFNDHKKRAEKRRDENRVDPSSLLQVNGIKSKIHLDLNTHKKAAKSLVIWQGDQATTIDRFDVRATLSSIPKEARDRSSNQADKQSRSTVVDCEESEAMKKILKFERYRLLIQNDLNRVPENVRLRLVVRSEYLSEAKMKKLKNNWFGTSGETSIPQVHQSKQYNQPQQQQRSQGVAIAYDYNTESAHDNNNLESTSNDYDLKSCNLLDSYDVGNLDLDCVDRPHKGLKRSEEIITKYGLSCEEFDLLIEGDSDSTCYKDMINRLKRLKEKSDIKEVANRNQNSSPSTFYGPVLPPDMLNRTDDEESECCNSSSCNGSPVQQRSPNGNEIPTRVQHNQSDDENLSKHNEDKSNQIKCTSQDEVRIRETEQEQRFPNTASPNVVNQIIKPVSKVEGAQLQSRPPVQGDGSQQYNDTKLHGSDISQGEDRRSRRGSTPLAYRRYRRSSRSLSRERNSSSGRTWQALDERSRTRNRSHDRRSMSSSCSSLASRSYCSSSNYSSRSSVSISPTPRPFKRRRPRRRRRRRSSYETRPVDDHRSNPRRSDLKRRDSRNSRRRRR